MSKNSPRGKLIGSLGKPYNNMTKKEKIEELRRRGKLQDDYVNGRLPDFVYNFGSPTKEAMAYLKRLKKEYTKLKGGV